MSATTSRNHPDTRNANTRRTNHGAQSFPPLEEVTRPNLTTKETAYYTNTAEQTWRVYACYDKGPIRPIRIGGRLNWPTTAVKKLCGVAA